MDSAVAQTFPLEAKRDTSNSSVSRPAISIWVLGVPPQLGREFNRMEDTAGESGRPLFSATRSGKVRCTDDRNIIGKAIALRGEPHSTVVGIMPRVGYRADQPGRDLWTPLRPTAQRRGLPATITVSSHA